MTFSKWRLMALGSGFVLAATCAGLFGAPAEAAVQGFGISPTSQDLSVMPGGSTKGQLTVINDGDTAITYSIYATDYRVEGNVYRGNFVNTGDGPNLSAISWFTLPKGNFTIGPRQETNFNWVMHVPKNAAVGGHYASVFIQTVPPPAAAMSISRVERIGSIFYLAVGGNLTRSGHFAGLSVPWLQFISPVTGVVKIANTGNVHFPLAGQAQLASPFGKVGTPTIFAGEVMPGTTRWFPLSASATAPIGIYKLNVSMTYLGQTLHTGQWVLLIPKMTLIICGSSLLLVIIAVVIWLVRRRKRRSNKASGGSRPQQN